MSLRLRLLIAVGAIDQERSKGGIGGDVGSQQAGEREGREDRKQPGAKRQRPAAH